MVLFWHVEPGINHAERIEDPLLEELVERLAREDLDEIALNVDRDAVVPAGARLMPKRHRTELVDHVLERLLPGENAPRGIQAVCRAWSTDAVRQPGRMRHQLSGRHGVVGVLEHRTVAPP